MELLSTVAYMVVEYVVYFLFAIAMGYGIKFIKDRQLKEIVEESVLFAQQLGEKYDLSGEEKFHEAVEYIKNSITLKFGLSEKRLEGLIEATLKRLKKEFKEQW